MTRYVALLRAVNLGATRRVSMPRLREVLAERGYGDVRTHLASGNVLLESPLPEAELAADLTAAIAEHFALDVPVVIRTAEELADVLVADPLGHVATNPARYSVTFHAEPLDPERVAALPAAESGEYVVRGREVYVWLPDGLQSDRGAERTWAQLLGATGTNRNWNTVRKLVELTR
ncbi:DUF1697 domain-containing protein [Blastococcus sp. VKM Ac-2987]|uniref:DUF1697 domain-containing protein n=1 Tax=Blastococcus sp. VKM Ac-2987 TaxID=3004141 RepID=UPI0022AB6CB3|nr:DUF1697 domain-containing protein [Blastococcus sp. VKM Ac-2987]MCZ2857403.1 DUF1697 domain-containing protein [Blastococcus sp. VKM Ac-2987]